MLLGGTMLGKRDKGETIEQSEDKIRRVLESMKNAKGFTGPMLGQLREVIGEMVGPDNLFKTPQEAADFMAVIAERGPKHASAYTRAFLREILDKFSKPDEMEALGIAPGMSPQQMVEAMAVKADEAVKNKEAFNRQDFFRQHGFTEARSSAAISVAVESGVKDKAFPRLAAQAAALPNGTLARENAEYLSGHGPNGEEGRAAADRSREIQVQRETAARYKNLSHFESEARRAVGPTLTKGETLVDAGLTKAGETYGYGGREEQEVRALTAQNLEEKLKGTQAGRDFLKKHKDDLRHSIQDHIRSLPGGAQMLKTPAVQLFIEGAVRANANNVLGRRYADKDTLAEAADIVEREQIKAEAAQPGAARVEGGDSGVPGAVEPDALRQGRAKSEAVKAAAAQAAPVGPPEAATKKPVQFGMDEIRATSAGVAFAQLKSEGTVTGTKEDWWKKQREDDAVNIRADNLLKDEMARAGLPQVSDQTPSFIPFVNRRTTAAEHAGRAKRRPCGRPRDRPKSRRASSRGSEATAQRRPAASAAGHAGRPSSHPPAILR